MGRDKKKPHKSTRGMYIHKLSDQNLPCEWEKAAIFMPIIPFGTTCPLTVTKKAP